MLSGEGNAGERWKTTIGLFSKKKTLHVQHIFFVHFFAVVLHEYNANLPETFLWRRRRTRPLSLFFTAAHFLVALVAASISYFVTAATKFSRCSSKKMTPFFFISCSSSLSPFFSLSFAGLSLFFSVFLLLYIANLWTWQLI